MYRFDTRTVATLDAGGTNLVFGAMRSCKFITEPITLPSKAHNLEECLGQIVSGFEQIFARLDEKPVAISFAFPGAPDQQGVIGGDLINFPSFRDGFALGPYLEEKFQVPVFINNDGDLFAYGEAKAGVLQDINRRVAALGGNRVYHNLVGFTFGTGLGLGEVINDQLNRGNNACIEVCFLRNRLNPELLCEENASIRGVMREYRELSGLDTKGMTPYDVFLVAEGRKEGDAQAAREAFARFGKVAGDVIAQVITLTDAIAVYAGGLAEAMKYIKPAMLQEIRSKIGMADGRQVDRLLMKVFDLDDEGEFAQFVVGDSRQLKVPGSTRTVTYDPMRRTGLIKSKLGASKAIFVGAYTYALSKIDADANAFSTERDFVTA